MKQGKKKGNFLSFAHNIWWWNSNKASFESAKGDVAKFPISYINNTIYSRTNHVWFNRIVSKVHPEIQERLNKLFAK